MNGPRGTGFAPVADTGLPVFRWERARFVMFYAPGFLVAVDPVASARFEADIRAAHLSRHPIANAVCHRASDALDGISSLTAGAFEPVCLTLYLGNQCNLHCSYCYACPSPSSVTRLDPQAVTVAARRVLANCERREMPFTVVVHGGGEPSVFPDLIERALDDIEAMASEHGIAVFRYIATNGVMPATRARWIANRFDVVGLSCDGPARFQAAQRPTWAGRSSTPYVERTARIVHAEGTPLHVRVTVTRDSLHHQAEIARYLCERIRPHEIHVEPLYVGGRAGAASSLRSEDAAAFVDRFFQAKAVAAEFGVGWLTSGTRVGEIHGRYCNVLRDVVQLVPGGVATTCFKVSDAPASAARKMTIARVEDGELRMDRRRIAELRHALALRPRRCRECFNQFHCTLGCPDACPLDREATAPGFRCEVQTALAEHALDEQAAGLWDRREPREQIVGAPAVTT